MADPTPPMPTNDTPAPREPTAPREEPTRGHIDHGRNAAVSAIVQAAVARSTVDTPRASPEGRDTGGGMTDLEGTLYTHALSATKGRTICDCGCGADHLSESHSAIARQLAAWVTARAMSRLSVSPLPAGGAEPDLLVEFFRNEMPSEGHHGDWRGDSPGQCAIHVMRTQRDEIARLTAARPDREPRT